MWHEARKHERKLRGMMVDYKKRAERRREYYEKIVSAPAQSRPRHPGLWPLLSGWVLLLLFSVPMSGFMQLYILLFSCKARTGSVQGVCLLLLGPSALPRF